MFLFKKKQQKEQAGIRQEKSVFVCLSSLIEICFD